MIIGLLLGIGIAFFVASLVLIFTTGFEIVNENIVTGAVIGTSSLVSYLFIVLVFSFIAILMIILVIMLRHKK